jgi:hypothetical protein
MRARMLQLARLGVLVAIMSVHPATSETPGAPAAADPEAIRTAGEVRLRKLHLVRPDLIPYPISFEVYC